MQSLRNGYPYTKLLTLLSIVFGAFLFFTPTAFAQDDAGNDMEPVTEPGVLIVSVRPDSAAADAGLQRGDIILRVGETAVNDAAALRATVQALTPGSEVTLRILHGDDEQEITVTLGELAGNAFLGVVPYVDRNTMQLTLPELPVRPEALPERLIRPRDELLARTEALSVTLTVIEVLTDTPAAAAGLQVGDQITAVNGTVLDSPRRLVQTIRALAPGDTITLTVQRNGTTEQVNATLAAKPDDAERAYLGIRFSVAMTFEQEWNGYRNSDSGRAPLRFRLFMPRYWEPGTIPERMPRLHRRLEERDAPMWQEERWEFRQDKEEMLLPRPGIFLRRFLLPEEEAVIVLDGQNAGEVTVTEEMIQEHNGNAAETPTHIELFSLEMDDAI